MTSTDTQVAPSQTESLAPELTESQAATLLGLSIRTLQRYRIAATGPSFTRVGPRKIRYARPDLVSWLDRARIAA
jgi:AraC-like DNA-binding protein